jgi:predicted metal-dependent peptidase
VRIANEYPELLEMIPSALYDAKYDGWSVAQVFADIKKDKQRGGGKGRKPMDKHDTSNADKAAPEQVKAEAERIQQDLQQGALMAGVIGDAVPKEVEATLAPQIDWLDVMQEFLTEVSNGRDDLTLARYDRRYVADDLFYPDVESESLGEIVLGFDMSGSTVGPEAAKMMAALEDFCIKTQPSRLRVLWWDTEVNSEQIFDSTTYANITKLAKPVGGGGTRAGCVSDYITDRNLQADAVLMFTDGYTEQDIRWQVKAPTLWMVTQRRDFKAPTGRIVNTFN